MMAQIPAQRTPAPPPPPAVTLADCPSCGLRDFLDAALPCPRCGHQPNPVRLAYDCD